MQDLQARAQIADANAGLRRLPIGRQARPVVIDTQAEVAVVAYPGNANAPSGKTLSDAVLDGIFHQRLQQQVGYLRAEQLRRYVDAHMQTLSEADFLNVHVALQVLDFLPQLD